MNYYHAQESRLLIDLSHTWQRAKIPPYRPRSSSDTADYGGKTRNIDLCLPLQHAPKPTFISAIAAMVPCQVSDTYICSYIRLFYNFPTYGNNASPKNINCSHNHFLKVEVQKIEYYPKNTKNGQMNKI